MRDRIPLGGGSILIELRELAAELVALAPAVIAALTAPQPWRPLQGRRHARCRSSSRVGADPVGAGLVASLARPGGNVTGFSYFDYRLSGKWLELLNEIVPRTSEQRCLRIRHNRSAIGHVARLQIAWRRRSG